MTEEIKLIKLWEKIKNYEYISFDIFDTLVKRNVSTPSEVFEIVEKKYNCQHIDSHIIDFESKRKNAEKQARENSKNEEVTLDEIYKELDGSSEQKKDLKKIEILTELQVCIPNYYIKKIYLKCLKKGKKIIITSDMYLPEDIIKKILNKCGYINYFKLYLSSSIKSQKISGNLFTYILNDLEIAKSQMVHIGDSKRADIISCLKKGIKPILIKREMCNLKLVDKENIFKRRSPFLFANNNILQYENKSEIFLLGYEAYGPLLLGFCYWIHSKAIENNIKKMYFLARDMNLVLKIYRQIYSDIPLIYLEVSRTSLRKAYILEENEFSAIYDTMARKKYTIRQLCDAVGMETSVLLKKCFEHHVLVKEDNCPSELGDDRYVFEQIFIECIGKTNDLTMAYLKEMGLLSDNKIAIVDIGWHGTIQNMLEKLTGKKYLGLYFGSTIRNTFGQMNMDGYWYNTYDEFSILGKLTMISILEVMLFPKIGTTLAYKMEKGKIIPIYRECEMDDTYQMIEEFQAGALSFISDYNEFSPYAYSEIPAELATKAYEKLAFQPTLHQAKMFSRFPYEEVGVSKIADVKKLKYYLMKPNKLLSDYKAAKWKTGFIKQICPFITNPHYIDIWIKEINKKEK